MIALALTGLVLAAAPTRPVHHTGRETPIADALVIVKQGPGGRVAETHTGKHGHFRLTLRPGRYQVIVLHDRSNKRCEARVRLRRDDRRVRIVCPVK